MDGFLDGANFLAKGRESDGWGGYIEVEIWEVGGRILKVLRLPQKAKHKRTGWFRKQTVTVGEALETERITREHAFDIMINAKVNAKEAADLLDAVPSTVPPLPAD